MNKKISVGAAIMLMAITAAVSITITVLFSMKVINSNLIDFADRQSQFKKLSEVDALVRENYVGTINEKTLQDDLLQGYMKGVGDKYGTYFNATDYKNIEMSIEGTGVGIGVQVVEGEDGYPKVVGLVKDSPAETAGVMVGDEIIKIGSDDAKSVGYNNAVNLLKGDVGSEASFTVHRGTKTVPFSIVRKKFEYQSATGRMIDQLGYVKITEFDANTADQFSAAVDSLVKQGAKGLIFDVRNNPGGRLDIVEKMVDKLVAAGPVVWSVDKNGKKKVLYTSDANQVDLPMAVVTNQNSASAAELFTAALKDYHKAKSIGTITYGKGTMQQIFDLNDGTALDLSIARFCPPTSPNFEGKGVKPDITIQLSQEKQDKFYELSDIDDDQLQGAISYLNSSIKG